MYKVMRMRGLEPLWSFSYAPLDLESSESAILPHPPQIKWCPRPDLNWHDPFGPQDFKSCASTKFRHSGTAWYREFHKCPQTTRGFFLLGNSSITLPHFKIFLTHNLAAEVPFSAHFQNLFPYITYGKSNVKYIPAHSQGFFYLALRSPEGAFIDPINSIKEAINISLNERE